MTNNLKEASQRLLDFLEKQRISSLDNLVNHSQGRVEVGENNYISLSQRSSANDTRDYVLNYSNSKGTVIDIVVNPVRYSTDIVLCSQDSIEGYTLMQPSLKNGNPQMRHFEGNNFRVVLEELKRLTV